ncbi:MAG: chromosome segregation protein SMC, partial [Oscillospiraceae bacterium]|nr:chromosome segregation protein SMC [Oscillospiraceae bacterium]
LEIHGFKSFPDKTVLTFENDITAVVGPNGSGKSNISDALRWVMGEQSNKALRGTKMEDVIFSGASGRAASGFAQVTLTLDNESGELPIDSTEVAITRRYYRSGDSEYYINRRSARLKDIHELLMDTGLGRDGYSIIGQGRIDEILSARSSDRREVFEEAAGISRFRSRKEDAQKKLDSAADNLLRINDKISELELQRGPLSQQAEVAKKYLLLRDELRGIEVAVWLDELSKAAQNAEKYRANAQAAKERVEEAKHEQAELFERINRLDAASLALEREADTFREKALALQVELTSLNASKENNASSKERNLEQINNLKAQLELSLNRRGELEAQIRKNDEQIESYAKRLEELADETKKLKDELFAANGVTSRHAERLNAVLSSKLDLTNRKAALEAVLSAAAEQQSQSDERRRALENELSLAKDRCDDAQKACTEAGKKLDELRRESEKQANMVKGFALKLKGAEDAYQDSSARLSSHSRAHSELESKHRLYSDMEREYEGYSKSVKKVMQDASRGRLKNIHGPVSQLLHVDGPYVTAIETVLGGALQNIIVSSRNDAKSAMELLKRENAGRATFLPIDAMKGSLLKEDPSREEGFVGIASELVSYDKQYEGIFRYLLGKTVVVENISYAIAMARKFSDRFRIVTLDGQVMNSGGSMTGGSVARSTGILSRSAELEKMAIAMQESAAKLEQLKSAASERETKLKAARSAHEAASIKARELESSVIRADGDLARLQAVERALGDAAMRLEKDIADHDRAVNSSLDEIKQNRSELSSLDEKLEKISADEEACTLERDKALENVFALRQRTESAESESAAVSAKREACFELRGQYRRLKEDAEGARKNDLERIDVLTGENERLEKEMA